MSTALTITLLLFYVALAVVVGRAIDRTGVIKRSATRSAERVVARRRRKRLSR